MASAALLRGKVRSLENIPYEIDVMDTLHGGGVTEIFHSEFSIDYLGKKDTPLDPIKASKATFRALNLEDYGTVFDNFIAALAGASEKRFNMVVRKDGDLHWVGNILIDQCTWQNTPKGRTFVIKAIDGLGRLKDIPHSEAIPGSGIPSQKTVMQHISDCLNDTGLTEFWGAGDDYILESFEDESTLLGALGVNESILLKSAYWTSLNLSNYTNVDLEDTTRVRSARAAGRFSQTAVTSDADKPHSRYKVLENIMKLYRLTAIFSDGAYHIRQFKNAASTTYAARHIVKAGTVSTNSVISSRQSAGAKSAALTLDVMAGGTFGYLGPIAKATVTTPNVFKARILRPDDFELTDTVQPVTKTIQLGDVVGGTDKKIALAWSIQWLKLGFQINDVITAFSIKFIFGANRLKSETTFKPTEWTTVASDTVERRTDPWAGYMPLLGGTFTVVSPDIPAGTHIGCTIEFTASMTSKAGISLPTSTFYNLSIFDTEVYFTDGSKFSGSQSYESDNQVSSDNSVVQDFGTLDLADEGIISTLNGLLINTTGSTWVPSTTWAAGYDTDETLVKTLIKEAMALQSSPVQVYRGPVTGDWSAHLAMNYNSKTFVFNGGRWDARTGKIDGEWIELIIAKGGIVIDWTREHKAEKYTGKLPGMATATKTPQKHFEDFRNAQTTLTKVNENVVSGSTITTIEVEALAHSQIKDNDTIYIYDPVNSELLETFVVDGNVATSATSITIDSILTTDDIPVGAIIEFKRIELISTALLRSDKATQGAVWQKQRVVSGTATILVTDRVVLVDTSSVPANLTMPLAANMFANGHGQEIVFIDYKSNSQENPITFLRAGSDTFTDYDEGQLTTELQANGWEIRARAWSASVIKFS